MFLSIFSSITQLSYFKKKHKKLTKLVSNMFKAEDLTELCWLRTRSNSKKHKINNNSNSLRITEQVNAFR